MPCNPPPTPALLPILSFSPPHHDKPDLLSIKGYRLPLLSPAPPFLPSGLHPICHLHCLDLGQLPGTRLSLPGLAAGLIGLAMRNYPFPQWQHLESHLMGLGTFANL